MKTLIIIFLVAFSHIIVNAQTFSQTISSLEKYAKDGFKNRLGKKLNDSEDGKTSFYQANFKLPYGDAQISIEKDRKLCIITWMIPMDKAKAIIPEFEKIMENKTKNDPDYFIENNGSKTQGYELKDLYMADGYTGEDLLMMSAVYSIDQKDASKGNYYIQILGDIEE